MTEPLNPLNALYQNLFEYAPNPTAVFDLHGRCLLINRAFANQLGYLREDFLTQPIPFSSLFPDPALADTLITEILARQIVRRAEMSLQTREGQILSVMLWGRALQHAEETHYAISFVDLSSQKTLQRAMRRAHHRVTSLIENLTAGLFLADPKGEITEINTALANRLGVEKSTLIAHPYQEVFARLIALATEPEVVQQWLETARRTAIQKPSVEFTIQDEKLNHLEITFFPVWDEDGHPLGWGGLVQDITDLREQTAWKFELLSILAHDLRAPLATLKGQATALLANYAYWGTDMVTEFLEAINRGVDTLTHEVDQNLALTRVEAGRLGLRPEAVAPISLVEQALERAAGLLEDLPITRAYDAALPNVRADPARVEEVIINLLENAVRYGEASRGLTVRVFTANNQVQIAVEDQGPGIPAEKQGTIFEKYTRAAPGSTRGTGLGLYISRKIIEAHGGRISVQSPPSHAARGAVFTFSLPAMPERTPTRPTPPTMPTPVSPDSPKILVVEDEPDFQTVLRVLLTDEGYRVDLATNGQTALDIVRSDPPDLVLLDWRLPGVDGLTVCRNLRRWSSVPVIMVTSKTAQEDILAAFDAGADDYVTKPFVGDELRARVRALLRRGENPVRESETTQYVTEGLRIDFETRAVWRAGQSVELTATEFDLLLVLVRHPRQVMTYAQLVDEVWGTASGGTRHALSVHISRLRNKLEQDPRTPRYLQTRWGVGYFFTP